MTYNEIKISTKILPAFHDFWRAISKYLFIILQGGRNSSKSTHISIAVIFLLMRFPVNALVVRKVANTLTESVFEQLQWAIDYLEVTPYWKAQKSPLSLTYIPTGNKIIFRGADEPQKIKSIKTSKFPIAILWIEELAEFKSEDEVDTIVNSVLRAELPEGLHYNIFYSYNPPKRKQSWVNKKYNSQFQQDNTFVHKSNYLDNPYVSEVFKSEAIEVKKKNEHKYKWIYLGEPIGGGIVPFSNLTFRTITDTEIKSFDNIKQGIDWGYAADAFCFLRLHYDKTRKKLYFIDEIHEVKLSNFTAAERIKAKGYDDFLITADSSEPKSIDEMRGYNLKVVAALKGPGSVEYGEKWLDDLNEIIIDYKRTPKSAKEFEDIDYEVDKDGNVKSKLEDKNNHSVDCSRYAMENDMRNISDSENEYTGSFEGL